jgi:hypothetical protein
MKISMLPITSVAYVSMSRSLVNVNSSRVRMGRWTGVGQPCEKSAVGKDVGLRRAPSGEDTGVQRIVREAPGLVERRLQWLVRSTTDRAQLSRLAKLYETSRMAGVDTWHPQAGHSAGEGRG